MKYIHIFIVACLLTSGCASKKTNDAAPPESPQKLYSDAAEAFRKKNYSKASELFARVAYEFPYYEGAKQAMSMDIYTQYMNQDYDSVVLSIDNFLKTYPMASEVSYMYYMRAISYYDQISNPFRDQSVTVKSKQALSQVIQRFPNTKYALDAKMKLDLVEDHLAAQEIIVGRYYLNRGELLAALKRFNIVVKKYSTTSHVDEALYRLFEIYNFMGNVSEAKKTTATLGYNYPNSRWYKSAYSILKHQK